jgi:hypothetical protein
MNQETLGWIRGFYEGEGHVRAVKGRSIQVVVVQKNLEPLRRLQKLFGGTISPQTNPGVSQWIIGGQVARDFLELIGPGLTAKRRRQIAKARKGAYWPEKA